MKTGTTKLINHFPRFQFGLRWVFVLMLAVALPLTALRYRANQVDEFNAKLNLLNESNRKDEFYLYLMHDDSVDWFTRIATRNRPLRLTCLNFYSGDANRVLDDLAAVGVKSIGLIDLDPYRKNQPIEVHDDTIEKLAKFKIEGLIWSRPLNVRQLQDLGKIDGLSFLHLLGDWLDDELFSQVGSSNSLRSFYVDSERLAERSLDVLDYFPKLERFKFSGSRK